MECFTHKAVIAVGICKVCGKAVCPRCVVEAARFVTCSDDCAKEAVALDEMNQRAKKIYGISSPKKLPTQTIFWIAIGLFFGGFGLYQSYMRDTWDWFELIFACFCFAMAAFVYRRSKDIGVQY